jgi:HSP20 family protein
MSMVRIRRSVDQEAAELQRRMERMMDRLLHDSDPSPSTLRGWVPRVDVFETTEGILVTLEIPGVQREEIEIVLEAPYLCIQGVRREPETGGCMRWHQMEIAYGPFERVLALPEEVDPESISATYGEGFLRISLRRRSPGGRTVPVKGA